MGLLLGNPLRRVVTGGLPLTGPSAARCHSFLALEPGALDAAGLAGA